MTINKSQGQTFQNIGIYLPNPVFSHGLHYVALSRVGKKDGLKIMVVDGWKEAKDIALQECTHQMLFLKMSSSTRIMKLVQQEV